MQPWSVRSEKGLRSSLLEAFFHHSFTILRYRLRGLRVLLKPHSVSTLPASLRRTQVINQPIVID
jgi:hypothetical protein